MLSFLSIILFFTVVILGIAIVFLISSWNVNEQDKSNIVVSQKDILHNCRSLYMSFIKKISSRDFTGLKEICSIDILQQIKYINSQINIPVCISFVDVIRTENINKFTQKIYLEFYCYSINSFIRDRCGFLVDGNSINIISFNELRETL